MKDYPNTKRLQALVGCVHDWHMGMDGDRQIITCHRCFRCLEPRPEYATLRHPDVAPAPDVSRLWGALTAAGKSDIGVRVSLFEHGLTIGDYGSKVDWCETEADACEAINRITLEAIERREMEAKL